MKYLLRFCIVVLLFSAVLGVAVYRTDPAVSPELESEKPLGDLLADALQDAAEDVGQIFTPSEAPLDTLKEAAADAVIGMTVDVSPTGRCNEAGQELLNVDVPAGTMPLIKRAVSEQLGSTVTTDDLLTRLNEAEGVTAGANEDGSLTIEVPEDVYEQYRDLLTSLLPE